MMSLPNLANYNNDTKYIYLQLQLFYTQTSNIIQYKGIWYIKQLHSSLSQRIVLSKSCMFTSDNGKELIVLIEFAYFLE